MNRLKVLVYGLNFSPEPTGIGKYTGELVEALCAAGHEVRVVTAPPYYPRWQVWKGYRRFWYGTESPSANLKILRCPLWVPAKPTGRTRLLHLLSFAITSLPVILWQRLWRPESIIVVVPTLFCVPGALLAMMGSRAKRIVHVQDLEVDAAFDLGIVPSRALRNGVLRAERWLLSRFDVVSSISRGMLERLSDKGIPDHKLMQLPNWFRSEQIQSGAGIAEFRFEWGLDQKHVIAFYSGSIGEKQGMEILLDAAAELEAEESVQFVICAEGPAAQRLQSQYGHLSNVVWRGLVPQERLDELLTTADIHLLPQRVDAADLVMPSKLAGMMASGRPVIATAAPGTEVAEVVEGRGVVVPPGNVEGIVAAIRLLAKDKELREKYGAAAREYAVEHFDKERILSRFERELVERVRGQGGRRKAEG